MTCSKSTASTLALLLALAACSKADLPQSEKNDSAADRSGVATPDINLTAAPGVAFAYNYRFSLAATRIPGLQEQHAAACEALGSDKCRITGLGFVRQGDNQATGTLELALAPNLARKFGKDAIAAVAAAKGQVASIEIDGEDKTPTLERSAAASQTARTRRAALEKELAAHRAPNDRADLLRQIETQRAIESDASTRNDEASRSLATTPMHFSYMSDGLAPAIRLGETAWSALGVGAMLINALLALVVVLGVLAIPLGLLLLALAHGRKIAVRLWQWLGPRPQPSPDIG